MEQPQNIAILGAGIMGLSTAAVLVKNGHKITLYDQAGFPANNASAMAGGMLAPYAEIEHMPPAWVEAGLAGIRFWKDMPGTGFEQNGSLLIAHEEDRYILARFKTHLPPGAAQTLRPAELEPALPGKFQSGLHLKDEAHLHPHSILFELCKIIKKEGVAQLSETVKIEEASEKYDTIIDCRGMGANDPGLRGVKGETLLVRNSEFSLSRPVRLMHPRYPLYIVPRSDHVFMIGATVIESADEQVTLKSGLELMSALYSLHPSFGEATVLEIKAGIRPAYPDNLPRIKTRGNVISCNGLFRHGFLLAPVMAQCVADRLDGKENQFMSLFEGAQDADHHQRHAA